MQPRFRGQHQKLTKVKSPSKILGMSGMIDHSKYKPLEGYLTISQIAKILGKSRQSTLIFVKRRKCMCIRVGDVIIIHKSELSKLKPSR